MGKGQEGAPEAGTVLGLDLGGGHTGIIRGKNPSSCTREVSSFHCAILVRGRASTCERDGKHPPDCTGVL